MLLPLLLAMGSPRGALAPDKLPTPTEKFTAQFIDQADVATECSEVSIEGKTFLEGKRGEGTFTVSFGMIDEILFRLKAERLTGIVKIRDGGTAELILNGKEKVYGRTRYGTFQIPLTDLKKMTITPGTQR